MNTGRYAMEFFKACTGRRSFEGWRQEWMLNKEVTITTPICNIMGQDVTYDELFNDEEELSPLGNIIVELIKFENQPRNCDFDNDIKDFVYCGRDMCGEKH